MTDYDTTQDQALNPNTTFVKPPPEPAPAAPSAIPASPGKVRMRDSAGEYDVPAADVSAGVKYPGQQVGAAAPETANVGTTLSPPTGARGAPHEAVTTTTSEPGPLTAKPTIDPRPYAWFAQHAPQVKEAIDEAAQATGTNPIRLAAHKWAESRGNVVAPRGADGEIGPFQFMPSTWKEVDPTGRLDPNDLKQGAMLAGLYVRKLNAQYGEDSATSIARYNGSGPKARAYARNIAGDIPDSAFHAESGGSMTPQGIVKAGVDGGPTAALHYMVQTAPQGMPMSDVWRHTEDLLVASFIRKGDIEGAQHARDFMLQLSHTGSNQYLMAAQQALARGDGIGGAQFLAKAHAFFPDGTMGQFSTDGRNVFAQRFDEHDPSRPLGPGTPITAQDVSGLLIQTQDPMKYLQVLSAQQKSAAEARLATLHGDYYAQLPGLRATEAQVKAQTSLARGAIQADSAQKVAETRAGATVGAAQIRAGVEHNNALAAAANKDAATRYDPAMNHVDGADPAAELAAAATMSEIHKGAMLLGQTPVQSERLARGLSDNTLKLLKLQNGNWGVVNASDTSQRVIGYLPKEYGDRVAASQQTAPQPSPVGAGAASPMAIGMGVTNNLSGTVMPQQPQAIPVSQSSAMPSRMVH